MGKGFLFTWKNEQEIDGRVYDIIPPGDVGETDWRNLRDDKRP